MVTALLWFLAAVVALLFLAIALPVRVKVRATTRPVRRLKVVVAPFLGAVPIPVVTLPGEGKRSDAPRSKPERPPREKPARKPRARQKAKGRRSWTARLARLPVAAMIGDVRRALRLRSLRAVGRAGLDDPSDTGQVWGWLAPALYAVPLPQGAEIAVAPAFEGATLDGEVELDGEVRLLSLARLGLRVIWAFYGPDDGGPDDGRGSGKEGSA